MGFQITGNTFIDSTRSAIFNANTTGANNFTVQITDRTVYVATGAPVVGTVAGFSAGGLVPGESNVIDKFPFANPLTAADHGDLTAVKRLAAGQSSQVSGYATGGLSPPASPADLIDIDKFPFASTAGASDIGDLFQARRSGSGQSSPTHGYTSGGETPPGKLDTIDKFPFATDTNASDVGNITAIQNATAGQSSEDNGYVSGGSPTTNRIDKFPFSADVDATDIADLTQARSSAAGHSSTVSGYTSGGGSYSDVIDKFPFAADNNAADVGNLVEPKNNHAGQSSKEYGFATGGTASPVAISMTERFSFVVDTDSVDVGNITVARSQAAGQQD